MPPGHCGHCMTLVENKKYVCERCGGLLCPVHRGRDSKHIFKTVYFCLANCPATAPPNPSPPDGAVRKTMEQQPVEYYSVQKREPEVITAMFAGARISSPSPSRPSTSDSASRPVTTSFGIIHTADEDSTSRRPTGGFGPAAASSSAAAKNNSSSSIVVPSRPPLHRPVVDGGSGGDEPQPARLADAFARGAFDGGGEDIGGDLVSRSAALDASSVRSPKRLLDHRRDSGGFAAEAQSSAPRPQSTGVAARPATSQGPPAAGVVIGGTPQFTTMHNTAARLSISAHGSRGGPGAPSRGYGFDLGPTEPPPATGTVVASPSALQPEVLSGISLDINRGAPVQPLPLSNVGAVFPTPEPIDQASGQRQVALGRGDIRLIQGEPRMKFAQVLFKTGRLARGVILGYIQSNSHTVWHERGEKYGQILLPAEVESTTAVQAAKCKHCGAIVSKDEAILHVDTHKTGGGVDVGTRVNSDTLGTACGDTALLARIVQVRRLGAGAQGEVWLCKDEVAQQQDLSSSGRKSRPGHYVAKRMVCEDEAAAVAKYQQSVRLMALKHVHLVQYLAVQKLPLQPPVVTVLMPFYNEGDVGQLIRNTRSKFSETYLCSLSLQIATALEFLHTRSPPIIHGDIKPENILLFNNREQVVLMDLDAAMELSGVGAQSHVATVKVGTTAWMAPEALHKSKGTILSDIWSLGLVMFVLAVLPDFPMLHCTASGSLELLNSLAWEQHDFESRIGSAVVGRGYTQDLAQVIVRLLSHDMKRRPVARQLMERLTLIMTNQLVS